ncbi:hypothetical protein LTR53_008447 [Teratosphaeriaceae sp. CCFEE 6253]|nr:hypothetical protein LTR53_008447 [Teratosphaeriaceae sp. CCFEE 6253]
MSLAATLTASGARPASFLPAIKCSSCGEEIEIAAMGDHICTRAPPSPHAQPASLTNPFTIRQMNASGHMPHAPSPLQQQSISVPLPKTRVRAPTISASPMPAPKAVRPPPPRINPEAANMPFLSPRPPRSDSPLSPALSARSGSSHGSRPPPVRSQTSPAPRLFDMRPPSPELSVNLDCAFPPFAPMSAGSGSSSRPGTANGRKTPSSERAPSRSSSRHDSSRSALPMQRAPWDVEPRSPVSNGGENVMNKMSTLKGGPFDANRRKPSNHEITPLDRRRPSLSSIRFGNEPPPIPAEPVPRPSTSQSNQLPRNGVLLASAAASFPDRIAAQKREPPPRPERPAEDVLPPRFLDHLSAEPVVDMPSTFSPSQPPVPMRSTDRSQTMPLRQRQDDAMLSPDLHKAPSEPKLRGRDRRPTLTPGAHSTPSQTPQSTSRQRNQSRSAPRADQRLQDAPPVPRPVQQHRQEKSHASSESGSSTASSARSHEHSKSSSGPSPISSAASSIEVLSSLTFNGRPYGDEEAMRVQALNVKAQSQKPGMRAEQPASRSPPRNFARPARPQDVAVPQQSPTLPALGSPPLPLVESPMDPMMQMRGPARSATEPWQAPAAAQTRPAPSRTVTMPVSMVHAQDPTPAVPMPFHAPLRSTDDDYDPYRPVSPLPGSAPASTPARLMPSAPQVLATTMYKPTSSGSSLRPRSPQPVHAPSLTKPGPSLRTRSPQPTPAPPPIPQEAHRPAPPTRRTTSGKPTCRGCNQPIEGKSVKAADGRLTGRWHKTCFTCRACAQPFTTADFYVLDNQPYCEQHYHEENGSLCHGCHRGIEGQYLETTSSSANGSVEKKFHPGCFTCHDCGLVLADDYFDVAGKVYCERHALAAMRGQARMAGPGAGGLSVPDRKALTAERRTTRLMMM